MSKPKEVDWSFLRISAKCVECGNNFFFDPSETFESVNNCTTTCAHCGTTLIVRDKSVANFHKYMHRFVDKRWPKDGKDCGCVEL